MNKHVLSNFARTTCALLVVVSGAAQASWEAQSRISLMGGHDSNIRRDYDEVGTTEAQFAGLLASLKGRVFEEKWQAIGTYDGALRYFIAEPQDSYGVQAARLEGTYTLGAALAVGADVQARNRQGGERNYSDLIAEGLLDFFPSEAVTLRLSVGGHRFLYPDYSATTFTAAEAGLQMSARPSRKHTMTAGFRYSDRAFAGGASVCESCPLSAEKRHDRAFLWDATYGFRSKFGITLGYDGWYERSNSFGESFVRHRVTLASIVRLPFEVLFIAKASRQWVKYQDGIALRPDLLLVQDEENSDMASGQLSRSLTPQLDVEFRGAVYKNDLPNNGLHYFRYVLSGGFTWRWDSQ